MKKLLFLGGSMQQVVIILRAKELGYYTIVCDYLPDNPGKKVADKFYLASTTDKELILNISRKEQIDGIVCYASDPASLTQAYVAEKLNLYGNPYDAVKILSNKGLFRKFLLDNNFSVPKFKTYDNYDELIKDEGLFEFPVILKPVDSSGSKGVVKLNTFENSLEFFEEALKYSRSKKIIVEEFIEPYRYQVAGDGFSVDGKLKFVCFGNDHFSKFSPNPFVPVAATFPLFMEKELIERIKEEIQRVFVLLKIRTGAYNFDIRVGKDKKIYLMEIGPRNGGNMIPQVIKYATGVDLVDYTIMAALGLDCSKLENVSPKGNYAYYALHSNKSGILNKISISPRVEKCILEKHFSYSIGDKIEAYKGSNGTIGILLLKFKTMEEMLNIIDNMEDYISVEVI